MLFPHCICNKTFKLLDVNHKMNIVSVINQSKYFQWVHWFPLICQPVPSIKLHSIQYTWSVKCIVVKCYIHKFTVVMIFDTIKNEVEPNLDRLNLICISGLDDRQNGWVYIIDYIHHIFSCYTFFRSVINISYYFILHVTLITGMCGIYGLLHISDVYKTGHLCEN